MRGALVVLALLAGAGIAHARGSLHTFSAPSFRDEGRNPQMFVISCSTQSWAVVVSSDAIRRSVLMQADPGNTLTVCLSTTTNSGDACSAAPPGTPGVKLTAGQSLTDYTTIQWTCRAATSLSLSSQTVSGYYTRDKGDYGGVADPALQ
jgi:hypothetical protein